MNQNMRLRMKELWVRQSRFSPGASSFPVCFWELPKARPTPNTGPMINRLTLPLLAPFALFLSACDDNPPPPPPQSSEELLNQAVPIDAKAQAELIKETEALKAKREEGKAELEKIRQQAASLKERADALQNKDYAKAASGNTPDALAAQPTPVPGPTAAKSARSASPAQLELENQLITFNLKRLCELADTRMDLSGAKSITFDDLVGPGKPIASVTSQAGEVYVGLVFTAEKKTYEVTTIDGRVIRYERGK